MGSIIYMYKCIYKYNIYVTYKRVNILYPWIRVRICGNGASHSNATFSTLSYVLRVSDAPLTLQLWVVEDVMLFVARNIM